jgi:hypothetical protein
VKGEGDRDGEEMYEKHHGKWQIGSHSNSCATPNTKLAVEDVHRSDSVAGCMKAGMQNMLASW